MGKVQPTFGDLFSAARELPGCVSVQVEAARFSNGDEIVWKLYYAEGVQRLYTAPTASALLEIIESLIVESGGTSATAAEQIAAVQL